MLRLFSIEHAFPRIANAGYRVQKTAQFGAQRVGAIEFSHCVIRARKAMDGAQSQARRCSSAHDSTYSAQRIDTDRWKDGSTECGREKRMADGRWQMAALGKLLGSAICHLPSNYDAIISVSAKRRCASVHVVSIVNPLSRASVRSVASSYL